MEAVRRWLLAASLAFVAAGVAIATGTAGPLLGWWHQGLAARWAPAGLGADVVAVRDFLLGALGAAVAGFWTLMAWLFHEPLRRREGWAMRAACSGVGVWLLLGLGLSAWQRAWFDVVVLQLPPLVLVGAPLWWLRRELRA